MIITMAWPSSGRFGGGVVTLYEYANAMARRGHELHFVHGPRTHDRIEALTEIAWFRFEAGVRHHIVDFLSDPSLPSGDICFPSHAPPRLGLPAVLIQGYKIMGPAFERPAFRARCPKLCVASWLIDVGIAWGSPAEQMLHVPVGLDHEVFHARGPEDERQLDVAMQYSPHPLKGGVDGLAALEDLRDRRPDVRVALFGTEEPDGSLPAWAPYRMGPTRPELAAEVYHQAKIFLQPSRREGLGLTALEAMACGCALVTTDNGGSRDYAFHDDTALVVPVQDSEAMAEAIDALLEDDARRMRLARTGVALAATFTWDRAAAILEGHLESYLADPGRYQGEPSDAPMFLDNAW